MRPTRRPSIRTLYPPTNNPEDDRRIILGTRVDRDRRTLYPYTLATGDRIQVAAFSEEEALEIAKTRAAGQGTVVARSMRGAP